MLIHLSHITCPSLGVTGQIHHRYIVAIDWPPALTRALTLDIAFLRGGYSFSNQRPTSLQLLYCLNFNLVSWKVFLSEIMLHLQRKESSLWLEQSLILEALTNFPLCHNLSNVFTTTEAETRFFVNHTFLVGWVIYFNHFLFHMWLFTGW